MVIVICFGFRLSLIPAAGLPPGCLAVVLCTREGKRDAVY